MATALLLLLTTGFAPRPHTGEYCITVRLRACRDSCHSRELMVEVTSANDSFRVKTYIALQPGAWFRGVSSGSRDGTLRSVTIETVVDEDGACVQYRIEVLQDSSVVAVDSGTIEMRGASV